jgi:hypothetical protein
MPGFLLILCALLAAWAPPAQAAATTLKQLLDLRPGEWRELPNTRMVAVFPGPDKTTWGIVGPRGVVDAWGGAAYDTKRNAFVFNGGGHADYGGNEVYAFLLEELRWERLTEASPIKKLESGQYVTTDDTPISAHTYDGLEYLPNIDRVFRNGGSEWRSGSNIDRSAWLFDMEKRRWERKSAGGGGFPVSAYDPSRKTVYVVGASYVDEYDPAKDVWTRRVAGQADFQANVGALDPENRRLVTDSFRPGVIVYQIGADGLLAQRSFQATQGATEWSKKMLALEYDPVRKVLVGWAGDRETAYLDGKTLEWRRHANTASAAAPVNSRERDYSASGFIYGRWRYVPKYDVFIGYNNPRGNVWVWKPASVTAGDTAAPPPPIRPLFEKAKPGETVTIPPGVYREAATISADNVVIKAHGVRLEGVAAEGKAALVVKARNVTIEGLECSGINVADENGGCVRLEGQDLTLRKVQFRDSQNGVMTWNRDSGTVLIEDSRFERLGRAHGVYVGRGPATHLIVRRSSFLSSKAEGHEIKSRAAKNTIEHNVVASLDGVDSRLIDLPEGGENVIRGNVLAKGPASSNEDLIGIGLEGHRALHSSNSTVIENNVMILERPGGNVVLHERGVPPARMERNRIIGGKQAPRSGNTWFPDRAAAGLPKYPALPKPGS